MTARDLMSTALVTMKPDQTLEHADIEMKLAAIRHIPIVDERGRLVGMLSNRDILRGLARASAGKVQVRSIMSKNVLTVDEEAPAHRAAELMLEHKIGAVPVLGEDQQLVGVLTETDFVRYAYDRLAGDDEE